MEEKEHEDCKAVVTQAVSLGLNFGFLFFFRVQSQIAIWAVKRMRQIL